MQKIFCYVDETGQETRGVTFFVSVVIVGQEREQLALVLEEIERESGKHKRKWSKSKPERRYAYVQSVLSDRSFIGKLYYGISTNSTDYQDLTIQTTARSIAQYVSQEYKATVIVDGLSKSDERKFAAGLRQKLIRTEKIRGATDEGDIFIRFADAIAGFIREAHETEEGKLPQLLNKAIKDGYIVRV